MHAGLMAYCKVLLATVHVSFIPFGYNWENDIIDI